MTEKQSTADPAPTRPSDAAGPDPTPQGQAESPGTRPDPAPHGQTETPGTMPDEPQTAAEPATPAADTTRTDEEEFIAGLIARGEAVPEGQPLTPGATHELYTDEHGVQHARRRRYAIS